jgi:hypothetical protein
MGEQANKTISTEEEVMACIGQRTILDPRWTPSNSRQRTAKRNLTLVAHRSKLGCLVNTALLEVAQLVHTPTLPSSAMLLTGDLMCEGVRAKILACTHEVRRLFTSFWCSFTRLEGVTSAT